MQTTYSIPHRLIGSQSKIVNKNNAKNDADQNITFEDASIFLFFPWNIR